MAAEAATNKYEFKAEVKQLLDILVHSLYSSREIFLREIISNASDALDKIRFQSIKGAEYKDKDAPLEIKVGFDSEKNIITVSDTGIGMTKEEVVENIGTIAKSGTSEFLKQLKESKTEASNIIGKFGVGFYSVFMVAKEVVLSTRSYQPDATPVQWKSDGLGDYEITEIEEDIPRGTTIEIYLNDDNKDFANKTRLEGIIKKHSNFISFPIYLENEKVNTISALWREPQSSVKKEQYTEFYKYLTHDTEEPMDTIHVSVDVPIQFNALMFIPPRDFDFFGFNKDNYGLDLYVRRVLIQHQNKDLLPEYLSFVKGVVDSEDLPLNISRETLQEDVVFSKISQSVTTQVLSHLTKKAKNDAEAYEKFWKEHGKVFKMGYGDFTNMEKYKELVRFNSSHLEDAKGLTSFADYVSRMKDGQKEIYYVFGPSREAINLDPHIEIYKKKGIEILYLFDPVDEFIMSSIRQYKEFELKSVDQVDMSKIEAFEDVVKDEKEETKPLESGDELQFSSLLEKIKKILGERVTDVKESKRLSDSPAVLVNPDDTMSSSMQRILRMANKDTGPTKKLFEINKNHPLVRNLLDIYKANDTDEYINETVEQLFAGAQLLEGDLMDPHVMVNRMNKLLEKSSGWYKSIKNM